MKMKTVLVAGKFDVLHPGHLALFEAARKLGDRFIVVVAKDSTIKERFGFEATYSEDVRKQFLDALSIVDEAIIGNSGDEMEVLLSVKPEIVCLGYDQPIDEKRVLEFAKSHDLKLEVVRLPAFGEDLFKSSKIKAKVVEKRSRAEVVKEFKPVGVKNKDVLESVPVVTGDYHEIEDWSMDKNGYFLIRVDTERKILELAHCKKLGIVDSIFEGKKPQDVYYELHKANLISRIDHAAYVGKELYKAYIALQKGLTYVQDSELEF